MIPHGCRRRVETLGEMLKKIQMARSPALHLAVVALLGLCCLTYASTAAVPLPPAPKVLQEAEVIRASRGADGQAILAREADSGSGSKRMELELEDYPGSGANDRHSPWRQERRN